MPNVVPESDRLSFREMNLEDLEDLYRMFEDNYARRFYPAMGDFEAVREWINWNLRNYDDHGFGLWALHSKQTGEFLGDCGLTYQAVGAAQELEIGYHLEASQRGHGYALEAARASLRHGFDHTGATQIVSIVAPDNKASIRVARRLHQQQKEFVNNKGVRRLLFYTRRPDA